MDSLGATYCMNPFMDSVADGSCGEATGLAGLFGCDAPALGVTALWTNRHVTMLHPVMYDGMPQAKESLLHVVDSSEDPQRMAVPGFVTSLLEVIEAAPNIQDDASCAEALRSCFRLMEGTKGYWQCPGQLDECLCLCFYLSLRCSLYEPFRNPEAIKATVNQLQYQALTEQWAVFDSRLRLLNAAYACWVPRIESDGLLVRLSVMMSCRYDQLLQGLKYLFDGGFMFRGWLLNDPKAYETLQCSLRCFYNLTQFAWDSFDQNNPEVINWPQLAEATLLLMEWVGCMPDDLGQSSDELWADLNGRMQMIEGILLVRDPAEAAKVRILRDQAASLLQLSQGVWLCNVQQQAWGVGDGLVGLDLGQLECVLGADNFL